MKLTLFNGAVVLPGGLLRDHGVVVEDGVITRICPEEELAGDIAGGDVALDAGGGYIAPGYIDLHVHGGGGIEVNTASPEELAAMCAAHAAHGTTSILPTVLAAPLPQMYRALDAIRAAQPICRSCNILGAHLEGPFLSPAQAGAQNPAHLLHPSPEVYGPLLSHWPGGIRMMGAAVELPGAWELGRALREAGVVATIAHSDATFEQVERAAAEGYSDVTHLYSGCSTVRRVNAYRVAGVVEAGLLLDQLTVQVIADGKHLPPALLRLIYKCKGAERISLITDGLFASASDVQEGTVLRQANGMEVVYEDGVLKMPDRQAFAGSAATTEMLVRNMHRLAGAPVWDAVRMASLTPATVLGLQGRKGSVEVGKDADLLLLDKDLGVRAVIVGGHIVRQPVTEP